eukprot:Skav234950  [mRNA]  locus=scaffold2817:101295:103669:- [translate_table: standard]
MEGSLDYTGTVTSRRAAQKRRETPSTVGRWSLKMAEEAPAEQAQQREQRGPGQWTYLRSWDLGGHRLPPRSSWRRGPPKAGSDLRADRRAGSRRGLRVRSASGGAVAGGWVGVDGAWALAVPEPGSSGGGQAAEGGGYGMVDLGISWIH